MSKIRLAIVGVGNCASSLLQGLEHYKHASAEELKKPVGLMHYDLGGYRPEDVEVACAFDIDTRKVGRPLEEACFALPNNTVALWPDLPVRERPCCRSLHFTRDGDAADPGSPLSSCWW